MASLSPGILALVDGPQSLPSPQRNNANGVAHAIQPRMLNPATLNVAGWCG